MTFHLLYSKHMKHQKHYVIYVPGIRDDMFHVQSLLIQIWRLQGVRPVMFAMPWSGRGAFEPKLARLVSKIDRYKQAGHTVSLVGASAGASAVLNAYVQRKDAVSAVVYICGKINRPDTVSRQTYDKNPAFRTSLRELQHTLSRLTAADKNKCASFYSAIDTTVPYSDTTIGGVRETKLPAFRHSWAILYALSFGSHELLRAVKGLKG